MTLKACETTTVTTQGTAVLSFAGVVRDTVKSTMQEAQHKSELIIGNIEDNDKDAEFMTDLCSKMDCEAKQIELQRLGRKSADRKRLLKASFLTQFDARSFKAKYTQLKRDHADIPSIRVRHSRTMEEQT